MKKLKRGSSRSAGFVACKRKNNAPRSERVRSAVVVFAFVLLARNVSGVIYVACLALARQDALREQLSRLGKAPLRCKRKNNNPRSGYIRPAVVVFAFVLLARNVSGRYLRRMSRFGETRRAP